MYNWLLPFLVFVSLGVAGCSTNAENYALKEKNITGVSFAASKVLIDSTDLISVKAIDAKWVALMPYGFIKEGSSELVYNSQWQWVGETSEGIINDIQLCKQQGFKIMLKPHVWITHGKYTGDFSVASEKDWEQFEASYSKYILEFAAIAENQHVGLFCMGTEWRAFVRQRPSYWQSLIEEIRKVYSGKITYAANWDEYKETPFWSELDYIGVNAYFPLSEKEGPSFDELKLAWQPIIDSLANLSNAIKKPILYTEFGYRSIIGTTIRPWESYTQVDVSMKEQELALEAMFESSWNKPWFAGGFLWKWFNKNHRRGGLENTGYTVQNKPTQSVVKKYYSNNHAD